MFHRKSITVRMFLLLLPTIAILLIVGNVLSYFRIKTTVNQLSASNLEDLARSYVLILSSKVGSYRNVAISLAGTPMLRPALKLALQMAGKVIANILSTEKEKLPSEVLKCFVVFPDGSFFTEEMEDAEILVSRELVECVTDQTKIMVKKIDILHSEPVVLVSAPIVGDGKVLAAAGVAIELSWLDKAIADLPSKNFNIVLTDSQGTILSHSSQPELRFTALSKLGLQASKKLSKQRTVSEDVYMLSADVLNTDWQLHLVAPARLIDAPTNSLRLFVLVTVSLVLAVSSLIVWLISSRLSSRVRQLLPVFESLKRGDLTRHSPHLGEDEIGKLSEHLNDVIRSLKELVKVSKDSAELVYQTAEQVRDFSAREKDQIQHLQRIFNAVGSNIKNVAATFEEVNASMEELGASVKDLAEKASQLLEDATRMKQNISDGNELIVDVSKQVQNAFELSSRAQADIDELKTISERIGKITEVISSISEQTNLLALNAAIEAARAGEAGRGFAVVAEEIRKLASQTKNSVQQIDELLTNTNRTVLTVVQSVSLLRQAVLHVHNRQKELSGLLEQVWQKLHRIVETFQLVAETIRQHGVSAEEVSRASNNAFEAVARISEEASKTQELVDERQEAVRQLEKVVEELIKSILQLGQRLDSFVTG